MAKSRGDAANPHPSTACLPVVQQWRGPCLGSLPSVPSPQLSRFWLTCCFPRCPGWSPAAPTWTFCPQTAFRASSAIEPALTDHQVTLQRFRAAMPHSPRRTSLNVVRASMAALLSRPQGLDIFHKTVESRGWRLRPDDSAVQFAQQARSLESIKWRSSVCILVL